MASDSYRSATRPPRRQARTAARTRPPKPRAEPFTIADGRTLFLRPVRPDDAAALRRAFARLTPEQVRLRVFHRMNELSEEAAQRLTHFDPETTVAYVVVDAGGEIRGEARIYIDRITDTAEFAVAVDPSFTDQGIGRFLMQRLLKEGRRRRLYEIWGDVLAENARMLDFARMLGAERTRRADDPGVMRVSFRLAPSAKSPRSPA